MVEDLISVVGSFYLDNRAIERGSSLTRFSRLLRDKGMLGAPLDLLAEIYFGRKFAPEKAKKLMNDFFQWAVRCDALNDYVDDLRSGIVFFSPDQLNKHNLNLVAGEKISANLKDLLEEERNLLKKTAKVSFAVLHSNLPLLLNFALYNYVRFKFSKLKKKKFEVPEDLIFAEKKNTSIPVEER